MTKLTQGKNTSDSQTISGRTAPQEQKSPRHDEPSNVQLQDSDFGFDEHTADQALPLIPLPFFTTTSGRYLYSRKIILPPIPHPIPIPRPLPGPLPLGEMEAESAEEVYDEDVNAISLYQREEVHLDIDGRYPQMTISGTRSGFLTVVGHWVASVRRVATGRYQGPIWYKDGSPGAIPHTVVTAKVTGGPFTSTRKLEITFSGGGAAAFTRTYTYDSAYQRKVEFEYDRVSDAVAVTTINTHAHPVRPASLPNEALSVETVFRRAGFDVSLSPGNSVIPMGVSGPDAMWTDQEMHDAMQIHWSRFANKPQWAMWVLFARLHVNGTGLGGIMFDDIGPNHRQGTAIFSHAFIATPPAGEANPAAWVARMRFWTAVHEMGHAFNLAHSWQKSLGTAWIPLANEPNARSFMNYPYSVTGGQAAFFGSFAYRFSDAELLFMRHAPNRFVEMGNEAWFSNHGFREAALNSSPDYELRLTTSREANRFPYLAPPVIEIALVNRSSKTKLASNARISERSDFTLIINSDRHGPRLWAPHLRHCGEGDDKVLKTGEAIYDSVIAGTGKNGWDMTEPGRYCIQAILDVDGEQVYSNQLLVTVEAPRSREEERLAADLFTPEVGQVLSVNGTRALEKVNTVLAAATELNDNPIAQLAAFALAAPLAISYKHLVVEGPTGPEAASEHSEEMSQRVECYSADPEAARKLIAAATTDNADSMVDAVGHTRLLRDAPLLAALERSEVPNGPSAFQAFDAGPAKAEAAGVVGLSQKMHDLLNLKAAGLTE